jgi:hypothetical protein
MAKKSFVPGEVLRAADVNEYLTSSRNVLINGGFDVWQRGTSFTTTGGYLADRWWTATGDITNNTISRSTSIVPPESLYSLTITKATTAGPAQIRQSIETINAVRLAGQTATFSVYLYASTSTTVSLFVDSSTATDDGPGATMTQLGTADFTVGGSWIRGSLSVNVPSNAKSLRVRVRVASLGVGATLYVGNAQLEEGSTATPFSSNANSIAGELAACQRYYYRLTAGNTYAYFGSGLTHTTGNGAFVVPFPTTLRRNPDFGSSAASTFILINTAFTAITGIALASDGTNTNMGAVTVTGTFTAGQAMIIRSNNNANAFIEFNAEL